MPNIRKPIGIPSQVLTIGVVCALKGGRFRHFYRWLKRDFGQLFPQLPERSRWWRWLAMHQTWTERFLEPATFFTVIATFGIELIHPIREARSPQQVGKKGKSNHRWIVGVKLCWLLNQNGQVVFWQWTTANECDNCFLPMMQAFEERTITLSDLGFAVAKGCRIISNCAAKERGVSAVSLRRRFRFSKVLVI